MGRLVCRLAGALPASLHDIDHKYRQKRDYHTCQHALPPRIEKTFPWP